MIRQQFLEAFKAPQKGEHGAADAANSHAFSPMILWKQKPSQRVATRLQTIEENPEKMQRVE